MSQYPQWRVGLNLWIETFDRPWLDLQSYDAIKDAWQASSGWDTDSIHGQQLNSEEDNDNTLLDLYIFHIHRGECRLLTRLRNQSFYVIDILPRADYEQWCKHNAQQ